MNSPLLLQLHRTEIKALAPQLALPSTFGSAELDIHRSTPYATFTKYPVQQDLFVRIGRDDTPGQKTRISIEKFKQTDPDLPEYTQKKCWVSIPPDKSSMGLNHIVVNDHGMRHLRCEFDCLGLATKILLATFSKSLSGSMYEYLVEFEFNEDKKIKATLKRGRSMFTDPITRDWHFLRGKHSLSVYSKKNDPNHMDLVMLRSLLALPSEIGCIEFCYPFLTPGYIDDMDFSSLLDIAAEFYIRATEHNRHQKKSLFNPFYKWSSSKQTKRLSIQDRDFSSIKQHRPRIDEPHKPWLTTSNHVVSIELAKLSSLRVFIPPLLPKPSFDIPPIGH